MDALEALRGYVHFLHEREGLRQVKLSLAARQGLARLASVERAAPSAVAPIHDRRSTASAGGPDNALSGWRSGAETQEVTDDLQTPRRPPVAPLSRPNPDISLSGPPKPIAASPVLPETIIVTGSNKAEQLRHLAERAAVCIKCPHLAARRHSVVFGIGNPEARLMFIGEAPGEEEDRQGEPFVGRAGQLLTKMIVAMGLTREQVYIANIVKCRPDMPAGASGNRKPTKQEMETCAPFLRAQIDVIKPAAMVALGATAVEGLLGPIGNIGSLRGTFLEYRGTPLMPTYHPSYLLRNQSNTEKRKVWEDLLRVMERMEMPMTEKQRGFFLTK